MDVNGSNETRHREIATQKLDRLMDRFERTDGVGMTNEELRTVARNLHFLWRQATNDASLARSQLRGWEDMGR